MADYDPVAAFYDLEHGDLREDADLYANLIREGPVLEIGAGTGRIVETLARSGLEVWGIDTSAAMLAVARAKLESRQQVHLVEGDIADLALDRTFAAAILALNTLWHAASLEAQLEMLRAIHSHLRDSGLLVVDMSNPLTMADKNACGEVRRVFHAPHGGGSVTRLTAAWDDPGEQILKLAVSYDVTNAEGQISRFETNLTLRYLYRSEAELLLQLSGFEVTHLYGSYDLEPFGAESPRIVIVARKAS